jgi:hypothetical protein
MREIQEEEKSLNHYDLMDRMEDDLIRRDCYHEFKKRWTEVDLAQFKKEDEKR